MSCLYRFVLVCAFGAFVTSPPRALQPAGPQPEPAIKNIPYADARVVMEVLRPDLLPAELQAPAAREAAWPGWVARRDRAIRARLAQGDDDAVVNFLLYGATFTGAPRPTPEQVARLAREDSALPEVLAVRIGDFIDGLAAPAANERLRFARSVVVRNGFEPDTDAGRETLQGFLAAEVRRAPAETIRISDALNAALARNDPDAVLIDQTAFRDRGLSSDTSLLIDFAVEEALRATQDRGLLAAGGVRRVGIVGPGLDFTDKDEGYDFYPQQTIQPFAVIDSLVELGLAPRAGPSVTAFDLNPRIIRHLEAARERAAAGEPYVLALPRNLDLPWNGPLVRYWERLGAAIGDAAGDLDAPPGAGNVRVRAVHVQPSVVLSIAAADLNIVLQRLEPLPPGELFDLIVATDILVYYDVFEQSLALANVAAMLRPGGVFITNTTVVPLPGMPIALAGQTRVGFMPVPGRGEVHDVVASYRRR